MPRVRIIGPIDGELREALMRLLGDAGCEIFDDLAAGATEEDADQDSDVDDIMAVEDVDLLPSEDLNRAKSSPECGDDVLIVVLSPECLAEEVLEKNMQDAAARGCHVVGVWPPDAVDQDLPRPFEDYGGDTVIWDPEKIRNVISRLDTQPTWSLPDDQPRPKRQLKRNKC